jgi:Protein of unknown function (DUF2867)
MIKKLTQIPADSLLHQHLSQQVVHHCDTFTYTISNPLLAAMPASLVLEKLLDGFLTQPPNSVTWLMQFRNTLVKPWGLRTSSLGCPVSSLAGKPANGLLYRNRFPVIDQAVNASDSFAQVVLGADDKHLKFRSCVAVELIEDGIYGLSLGTKVHCLNTFGRFYMWAIDSVHQRYVSPKMLKTAGDAMLIKLN